MRITYKGHPGTFMDPPEAAEAEFTDECGECGTVDERVGFADPTFPDEWEWDCEDCGHRNYLSTDTDWPSDH